MFSRRKHLPSTDLAEMRTIKATWLELLRDRLARLQAVVDQSRLHAVIDQFPLQTRELDSNAIQLNIQLLERLQAATEQAQLIETVLEQQQLEVPVRQLAQPSVLQREHHHQHMEQVSKRLEGIALLQAQTFGPVTAHQQIIQQTMQQQHQQRLQRHQMQMQLAAAGHEQRQMQQYMMEMLPPQQMQMRLEGTAHQQADPSGSSTVQQQQQWMQQQHMMVMQQQQQMRQLLPPGQQCAAPGMSQQQIHLIQQMQQQMDQQVQTQHIKVTELLVLRQELPEKGLSLRQFGLRKPNLQSDLPSENQNKKDMELWFELRNLSQLQVLRNSGNGIPKVSPRHETVQGKHIKERLRRLYSLAWLASGRAEKLQRSKARSASVQHTEAAVTNTATTIAAAAQPGASDPRRPSLASKVPAGIFIEILLLLRAQMALDHFLPFAIGLMRVNRWWNTVIRSTTGIFSEMELNSASAPNLSEEKLVAFTAYQGQNIRSLRISLAYGTNEAEYIGSGSSMLTGLHYAEVENDMLHYPRWRFSLDNWKQIFSSMPRLRTLSITVNVVCPRYVPGNQRTTYRTEFPIDHKWFSALEGNCPLLEQLLLHNPRTTQMKYDQDYSAPILDPVSGPTEQDLISVAKGHKNLRVLRLSDHLLRVAPLVSCGVLGGLAIHAPQLEEFDVVPRPDSGNERGRPEYGVLKFDELWHEPWRLFCQKCSSLRFIDFGMFLPDAAAEALDIWNASGIKPEMLDMHFGQIYENAFLRSLSIHHVLGAPAMCPKLASLTMFVPDSWQDEGAIPTLVERIAAGCPVLYRITVEQVGINDNTIEKATISALARNLPALRELHLIGTPQDLVSMILARPTGHRHRALCVHITEHASLRFYIEFAVSFATAALSGLQAVRDKLELRVTFRDDGHPKDPAVKTAEREETHRELKRAFATADGLFSRLECGVVAAERELTEGFWMICEP
ncbi:hypothetical protein HDU88_006567 [Geranomyces variabilis]|nr:hypothetical protein HDU88_006567 [Geranomyces variabilis]